jgi:hypothetical protein
MPVPARLLELVVLALVPGSEEEPEPDDPDEPDEPAVVLDPVVDPVAAVVLLPATVVEEPATVVEVPCATVVLVVVVVWLANVMSTDARGAVAEKPSTTWIWQAPPPVEGGQVKVLSDPVNAFTTKGLEPAPLASVLRVVRPAILHPLPLLFDLVLHSMTFSEAFAAKPETASWTLCPLVRLVSGVAVAVGVAVGACFRRCFFK